MIRSSALWDIGDTTLEDEVKIYLVGKCETGKMCCAQLLLHVTLKGKQKYRLIFPLVFCGISAGVARVDNKVRKFSTYSVQQFYTEDNTNCRTHFTKSLSKN